MRIFSLLLFGFFFLPTVSVAATTTKAAPKKNYLEDFKFSGYIDGSYNYLVRSNQFTSGTFDRVFDITENGFTLQQAAITLAYQPKQGFGALLNPMIGRDTYTFAPYGWDSYLGSQWLGFAIPQAYLQYALNSWTFSSGSFLELAGAETLSPTANTNFSRAILYGYAEPYTVTGIRAAYVVNDKINFIFGINDGWDSIRDTSRRKTLELNMVYTPNALFSLAMTGYSGGQRAADKTASGPQSIRNLLDIITTFNITEQLTLIANYDYGIQSKAALPGGNLAEAVWQGIAGYANYKFNDKWRTSIRGEIFSDRNGYKTGVAQCWKELTLTFGFAPIKNAELRVETRHDFSNVSSFINGNGRGTNNNQQSYALEDFYMFS